MAKKSTKKSASKRRGSDYYSEGVNFSDDPNDSFYATGDDESSSSRKKSSSFNKELVWGFQWGELAVLFLEALLLVYILLVLLGFLPLW